MQATPLSLALTLAAALAAGSAQANTTLTFQHGVNGYTGGADTYIKEMEAGMAHGGDSNISIDADDDGGHSQSLLRFDGLFGNGAGQIKASDVIVSARVTLSIDSGGSGVQFHDMLQMWNESTITWNNAKLGGNTQEGIQADGVEAAITPFFSFGANDGSKNIDGDTFTADVTSSLMAIQAGTLPGYGWALLPYTPDGTNGLDFYTQEGSSVFTPGPVLTVEIAPVPEPETYAMMLAGLGLLGFVARRRANRA